MVPNVEPPTFACKLSYMVTLTLSLKNVVCSFFSFRRPHALVKSGILLIKKKKERIKTWDIQKTLSPKCPKWKASIFFPHTFQIRFFCPIPILPLSEICTGTQACYSSLLFPLSHLSQLIRKSYAYLIYFMFVSVHLQSCLPPKLMSSIFGSL